jgi:hypothetical protein
MHLDSKRKVQPLFVPATRVITPLAVKLVAGLVVGPKNAMALATPLSSFRLIPTTIFPPGVYVFGKLFSP